MPPGSPALPQLLPAGNTAKPTLAQHRRPSGVAGIADVKSTRTPCSPRGIGRASQMRGPKIIRTIPHALLPGTADAALVATQASSIITVSKYFASGGICACASHSVGVPLDVVKTRVQAAPEDSPLRIKARAGLVVGAAHLVNEEGPGTLLQGAGPTFTGYFLQGSFKYGLYQVLTSGVTATGGNLILAQLLAASAADVVGSSVLCPLEATRIRMVVRPGYSTSFPNAFQRLCTEEGFDGLYSTLPAILAKQVPYTALQLVTYDQVHSSLLSAGAAPWAASLAGALSAAIPATLASQPGDTLLTLLNKSPYEHPPDSDSSELIASPALSNGMAEDSSGQNHQLQNSVESAPQTAPRGRHIGMVSCVKEMALLTKELGIRGLYVGCQERLWHVGTIVVSQLLINDAVKHWLGL